MKSTPWFLRSPRWNLAAKTELWFRRRVTSCTSICLLEPKCLPESRELDAGGRGIIDLAVFYDRNNLLLSPSEGPTPGNHFAIIIKNREGMRQAGHDVWREGFIGESLIYRRLEGEALMEWGLGDE